MQFELSSEIQAPSAVVWAAVSDVESWPQWTTSMREVRWLDARGLAIGARARVKQPRMPPLVWTVCELDDGHAFAWRTASLGVTTIGAHRIAPLDSGRTLLTLAVSQTGALASLVGLLTGSQTRRYVQMELDGLKRAAETAASGDP